MKKNSTVNLVIFDVAFWGLLAALWIAGAYQIYYTAIEELAIVFGIHKAFLWLVTILIISSVFLIFRKRIHVFQGEARKVAAAKHRKKKKK